ncbi:hypothetical protein RYX36_016154, partial [Vicia faba]
EHKDRLQLVEGKEAEGHSGDHRIKALDNRNDQNQAKKTRLHTSLVQHECRIDCQAITLVDYHRKTKAYELLYHFEFDALDRSRTLMDIYSNCEDPGETASTLLHTSKEVTPSEKISLSLSKKAPAEVGSTSKDGESVDHNELSLDVKETLDLIRQESARVK